jgi:hypothetical protein
LGLNVGQPLADTFLTLWKNQDALTSGANGYIALGDTSPIFTAVGTIGDPVYDFADLPGTAPFGTKNIGIVSQVYFSEPGCVDSGFDLSSQACTVIGRSLLDPCGPLDDGGPPLFGVPGSLELHSIVKNCPGVIGFVMRYVSPVTGIPFTAGPDRHHIP